MEKTEEVLKKQLIDATEGGKYRILIHRTFTGGDNLEMDGITRSICQTGLRVFDGSSIDFTTSDYRNDINLIMSQIINAYTYKGSDKVFILKVPVGALEYIPGKSEPILCEGEGRNLYNSGKNCMILPQYIIGYVDVSKEGISTLKQNTCQAKENKQKLLYADSVISQYRWTYPEALESIRTDKFYTDEEKMSFLRILYCNYRKDNRFSKSLKRDIERLMPASDLEERVWPTSANGDELFAVKSFVEKLGNKTITKKMIEREFSKTRKLKASEIYDAIPSLLRKEKTVGRALTLEEIIEEYSMTYGFDKDIVIEATMPKNSIWSRFSELFTKTKDQKLLEAPKPVKEDDDDHRTKFVEELRIDSTQAKDKELKQKEQGQEQERE